MTLTTLSRRLTQYDGQEARSIVRLLLEDCFGWTYTDICCGVLDSLSEQDTQRLETLMKRLQLGEPVQYVTGKAEFYGREFHVEPGVLIPRPETEELVEALSPTPFSEGKDTASVDDSLEGREGKISVLDIGTGSGCLAITLAKEIDGAEVTAWDISDEALRIAKENAERLGAKVEFRLQDALNAPDEEDCYDIIVSNPPYICNKEAMEMEGNVLEHEPHLALFVPDNDPLLFYKKITSFASRALREGGILAFEINPLYSKETFELVSEGFQEVAIHQDQFGKARCLLARKRSHAGEQNV